MLCCALAEERFDSVPYGLGERGRSEDSKVDDGMVKQEEPPGFREGAADDDRSIELV